MCSIILVTVSAEGRVEHQKLNQTTALLLFGWVFGVQLDLLENKCPIWREKPCKASFGWVCGVQLDLLKKVIRLAWENTFEESTRRHYAELRAHIEFLRFFFSHNVLIVLTELRDDNDNRI